MKPSAATPACLNAHRSFYYDVCEGQWYSEDDTVGQRKHLSRQPPDTRARLLTGFAASCHIMLGKRVVQLNWDNLWAPVYNVYLASRLRRAVHV